MPVENNQIIAEWLGYEPICDHELSTENGPKRCSKCGELWSEWKDYPDFTTFAGMEVLLKALGERVFNITLFQPGTHPCMATIDKGPTPTYADATSSMAIADTPPLALTEAVLKLIERGETNGKQI